MRRMPTALAAATLAGLLTTGAALRAAPLRLAQVTAPSGMQQLTVPPPMPTAAIMPPDAFGGSHSPAIRMERDAAPSVMEHPSPAAPAAPEGPIDPDDQGGVRQHQ